jgi:hypothetical protein
MGSHTSYRVCVKTVIKLGEWRKLHNEKLNDLYSSPTIEHVIRSRMKWAGHVAYMGEERGVYRILVRKHEEKRP